MIASQYRILMDQLVALRAEVKALRESNTVLLKVLVAFSGGQTPERWMENALERAKRELASQVWPQVEQALPPRGADGSASPFAVPERGATAAVA
jgi:hypothetical protein